MKRIFFFIVLGFFISSSLHAQSFFMLNDTNSVVEYYTNGSINSEIEEILSAYTGQINAIQVNENTAAVFDIDETCMSNFGYFRFAGFTMTENSWSEWVQNAGPEPIIPVQNFYNSLVQRGFKIIFITGRPESEYQYTYNNLRSKGYGTFDTLICKPAALENLTAQEYKTQTRAELTKAGYDIVVNTGDQFSDILGGNSGIMIKLPNYMYYIR